MRYRRLRAAAWPWLASLLLAGCDGASGHLLGNEDTPLCRYYNNCDGKSDE